MKCCSVQIYLAGRFLGKGYSVRAAMSYDLALEERELAQLGYYWIWPLTEKLGVYPAYQLLVRLSPFLHTGWQKDWLRDRRIKKISQFLRRERWLTELGIEVLPKMRPQVIPPEEVVITDDSYRYILALLRGRNLFFTEILKGCTGIGLTKFSPKVVEEKLLKALVHGKVELVPANLPDQSLCLRCQHQELKISYCGLCGKKTWICPECAPMGESLTCRPLFRRRDRGRLEKDPELIKSKKFSALYQFPLSSAQKRISQVLSNLWEGEQPSKWLLWAVCGAGKTETTFQLITNTIQLGGRVLFTSPRREVVRQMVKRLEVVFAQIQLVGLYGGSKVKLSQGLITVATVHQLVRFYRSFDLIIFDEIDAFPYQGDQRLMDLLQRSLKETGKLVMLSATPGEDLLKEVKTGQLQILTLPARFHRRGVPVPKLVATKLPGPEYRLLPVQIQEWIKQSIYQDLAQLYIFLPTIKMVEIFGQSLKQYFRDQEMDWVEYTHSQDPERGEKVENFLQGRYPILVTTSIMERGVTVPKSNVLVLYADREEIFNYQSLIQMAGRGGRSLDAPHAEVWFVGSTISREMKRAYNWINQMNQIAGERGLLDDSDLG